MRILLQLKTLQIWLFGTLSTCITKGRIVAEKKTTPKFGGPEIVDYGAYIKSNCCWEMWGRVASCSKWAFKDLGYYLFGSWCPLLNHLPLSGKWGKRHDEFGMEGRRVLFMGHVWKWAHQINIQKGMHIQITRTWECDPSSTKEPRKNTLVTCARGK